MPPYNITYYYTDFIDKSQIFCQNQSNMVK